MTLSQDEFDNPLQEVTRASKTADPCVLVIFGATGDLTARKLLPALYNLAREGQLPTHFACVAFARRDKTSEDFRNEMKEAVSKFSRVKPIDQQLWGTFSQQLFYHKAEFHEDSGYESLSQTLQKLDSQFGTKGNRVFYLSTQASFFPLIIRKLSEHHLIYNANEVHDKWSRVVIEKPFGHDLKSALDLQQEITHHLAESQIYRIDHYLGKETVQNLLVFRFSNPIFESVWNNHYIDHVQITVSEDIGIGTRGKFWEESGMLRDIVQNHVMQLLSLVAMEPPTSLNADSIRNEKVKVVESIRPLPKDQFDKYAVRAQYAKGYVDGLEVRDYRQEDNVAPLSNVETYVALKLYIDNWRWSGVPFFVRAGKRLAKRATEISISFKKPPCFLFPSNTKLDSNVLVIRIQPDEGISLKMNCKVPGLNSPIQPVKMDFRYGSYFGLTPPEAYERLICDCMSGDSTLFARVDEVLASWRLLTPLLEYWQSAPIASSQFYPSGTWGPTAADQLIASENRKWRTL